MSESYTGTVSGLRPDGTNVVAERPIYPPAPAGDTGAMATTAQESFARFEIDASTMQRCFDTVPFGFEHNFSGLDLFSFDAMQELCDRYASYPDDYYIAASAAAPTVEFYSGETIRFNPLQALDRIDTGSYRVLLKRMEVYFPRYRDLLETLFGSIAAQLGLNRHLVVRLESSVLISSPATTTPFHFDPEINFFAQIAGEKIYHLYAPAVLDEAELERFYVAGVVNVGQVDLERRDRANEHVFLLRPGKGLHQPQNAPHWVETGSTRSVSYALVFETRHSRARGRIRACNRYLRRMGLAPAAPGRHPAIDAVKSGTMRVAMPVRDRVHTMVDAIRSQA